MVRNTRSSSPRPVRASLCRPWTDARTAGGDDGRRRHVETGSDGMGSRRTAALDLPRRGADRSGKGCPVSPPLAIGVPRVGRRAAGRLRRIRHGGRTRPRPARRRRPHPRFPQPVPASGLPCRRGEPRALRSYDHLSVPRLVLQPRRDPARPRLSRQPAEAGPGRARPEAHRAGLLDGIRLRSVPAGRSAPPSRGCSPATMRRRRRTEPMRWCPPPASSGPRNLP